MSQTTSTSLKVTIHPDVNLQGAVSAVLAYAKEYVDVPEPGKTGPSHACLYRVTDAIGKDVKQIIKVYHTKTSIVAMVGEEPAAPVAPVTAADSDDPKEATG